MFIFILFESEEQGFNYPKYIIILKNSNLYYFHDKTFFYYLISSNKYYTCISCKFPTYFVIASLYFDRHKKDEKFNLSKLGTDYILNIVCTHHKEECTGSYPENYIFVNEPEWPVCVEDKIDISPLKLSHHSKG